MTSPRPVPARRRLPLTILGAALLMAGTATVAPADEVILVTGSTFKPSTGGRVRGQVQSENSGEVVVQLGNSTTNVPTDQIASIRYDGQPATIQLAESRENAGQLAEAAELYKKAAGEAVDKPFVVQSALYHEAAALADLALIDPERAKDAKDRLVRFVQKYPTGRHIISAREDLTRIQLAAGDFSAAGANVAELAKLPKAAEKAAVLKARILTRQGKNDEALSELDRILASAPDHSTAQREARLAKAESLAAAKKYQEAEALVRQVILANPAEDVAAQSSAYNTLGDCLREANRPKDALLAYLHTDLLYGKDRIEHPRALFQIAKLFRVLKQDGRADEYAQRLRTEYPRSPWVAAK
ncbi:tetratricopeptide repeat protein [Aquisphaera insulae]|uniref:tetratricopeptide repeat protein n=1 Tax=Aquisphaera insulae TaxID=2712864 RepID=UPI0020309646|nr:tetratricopeptide repeat protein [Aquisphaera insulae]